MEQTEKKSHIKSIAQARAKYAWECAQKNQNDEYASLVRKIPTYIKANGLLNTIAFLYTKSKENNREEEVLNNIKEWLTNPTWGLINKNELTKIPKNEKEKEKDENYLFINYLLNSSPHDIIQYTSEVINLFTWLRRFVKSEE